MKLRAHVPGHERTLGPKSQLFGLTYNIGDVHCISHCLDTSVSENRDISATNQATALSNSFLESSPRELSDSEPRCRSRTAPVVGKSKNLLFLERESSVFRANSTLRDK